jgi:hypothetical protein
MHELHLPGLDFGGRGIDNEAMEITGRVQNGVVVLEGGSTLPDGMPVSVVPRVSPVIRVAKRQRRVVLPLVPSQNPGSVDLTGERIAEILDKQDAPS